jgi:hypothetical protein
MSRPTNPTEIMRRNTPAAIPTYASYALRCRRFVPVLTDRNARLGADVGRYSFIAVDLHHLLLAGLPAHAQHNPGVGWVGLGSQAAHDKLPHSAPLHAGYACACRSLATAALHKPACLFMANLRM